MMKKTTILLLALLIAGSALAQETYYSIFSYDRFIPRVTVNDHSPSLQSDLLPEIYKTRSVRRDMNWVAKNDTALANFWNFKGDTVLHILTECSGINWQETDFDIYLVRYFPSAGSSDPLIVPLGGIYQNGLLEAVPTDNRMILNLLFQLSKRMLAQSYQPQDNVYLPIASHPLMRPGPYRLDNLAMLLALTTAQNVIGVEAANDAFKSAYFKKMSAGREIFDKYFANRWILTPDHPLVDWVAAEGYNSKLVLVTRTPRRPTGSGVQTKRQFIEGVPLKGQLGFSTRINERGYLVVDQIDTYRLAYACGLRTGDVIRRVDERLARTQKQLITYILEGLNEGGVVLQILRDGQSQEVLVRPIDYLIPFNDPDAEQYWEYETDSLDQDTAETAEEESSY